MEPLFYKSGLRFECKRCGNCCNISDAVVYLVADDIQRISKFLGISESLFLERYTTEAGKFKVLKDGVGSACIFFDGITHDCKIYDARPIQCRTFPFWSDNLKSEENWIALKSFCPGIDEGEFFSFDEIEKVRRGDAVSDQHNKSI